MMQPVIMAPTENKKQGFSKMTQMSNEFYLKYNGHNLKLRLKWKKHK